MSNEIDLKRGDRDAVAPRSEASLGRAAWWAVGALAAAGFAVIFWPKGAEVPVHGYRVVNTYPHDKEAYCQGLVYTDGILYESTGLKGKSTVRHVDLTSGGVRKKTSLDATLFGEGIAVLGDRIIQVTWESRKGFVYDKKTLRVLSEFKYEGQGWGLTHDGKRLILSDGTSTLRFLDPKTFEVIGKLDVRSGNDEVPRLNELEFIKGEIWANLYLPDQPKSWRIARIDPETGNVNSFIDLRGILDNADFHSGLDVLNGIAWDAEKDRIFVTGKNWPKLFEIEVVEKSE